MAEQFRKFVTHLPIWYWVLIFLCFVLLITSFLVPPLGVIDPSVLKAVAEILGFSCLGLLPGLAETISLRTGDTSIDIVTKKQKKD